MKQVTLLSIMFLIFQVTFCLSMDLHEAAGVGNYERVKELLDVGVSPDEVDAYGYAPLHRASGNSHETIVGLLLERGADVNVKTVRTEHSPSHMVPGRTPLHCAVQGACEGVVARLLENEAEVSALDEDENTPFHLVLSTSSLSFASDMATLLLAHGADINRQNAKGQTLLHGVCKKAFCAGSKHLLQRGASVEIKDREGNTPLHFALGQSYIKRRLLLSFLHEPFVPFPSEEAIKESQKRVKSFLDSLISLPPELRLRIISHLPEYACTEIIFNNVLVVVDDEQQFLTFVSHCPLEWFTSEQVKKKVSDKALAEALTGDRFARVWQFLLEEKNNEGQAPFDKLPEIGRQIVNGERFKQKVQAAIRKGVGAELQKVDVEVQKKVEAERLARQGEKKT